MKKNLDLDIITSLEALIKKYKDDEQKVEQPEGPKVVREYKPRIVWFPICENYESSGGVSFYSGVSEECLPKTVGKYESVPVFFWVKIAINPTVDPKKGLPLTILTVMRP